MQGDFTRGQKQVNFGCFYNAHGVKDSYLHSFSNVYAMVAVAKVLNGNIYFKTIALWLYLDDSAYMQNEMSVTTLGRTMSQTASIAFIKISLISSENTDRNRVLPSFTK